MLDTRLSELVAFKDYVSWGMDCYLFEKDDIHGLFSASDTKSVIVSCSVNDWNDSIVKSIKQIADDFSAHPCVLFYGQADADKFHDLNWSAHENGFAVYWNGARNNLDYVYWLESTFAMMKSSGWSPVK